MEVLISRLPQNKPLLLNDMYVGNLPRTTCSLCRFSGFGLLSIILILNLAPGEAEETLENVVPTDFVLLVNYILQLRRGIIRRDGERTVE